MVDEDIVFVVSNLWSYHFRIDMQRLRRATTGEGTITLYGNQIDAPV